MSLNEDFIVNNSNIFGLLDSDEYTILFIQLEIIEQLSGKDINSILDYFNAKISLEKKSIMLSKSKNFFKVLEEQRFNYLLKYNEVNCGILLNNIQTFLLDKYYDNECKQILTFTAYKSFYSSYLTQFLNDNIDTDEGDFIKYEMQVCENILKELEKPIYNKIGFGGVFDAPCSFKKNLSNSIDKRKKYLLTKLESFNTPMQEISKTKTKEEKFTDIITIEKASEFITEIKKQYNGAKGRSLKLLFLALKELSLITESVNESSFNRLCRNEFDGKIGSRQGMNKHKIENKQDKIELDEVKTKITQIIDSL